MAEIKSWVILTGGSKGIGKYMGLELARRNYHLILVARDKKALEETAAEIKGKFSIEIISLAGDISDRDFQDSILALVENQKLSVAGLINNAGSGLMRNFANAEFEKWDLLQKVNVDAVMRLTHLFIPKLMQVKGAFILNVSSLASFQPVPGMSVYAASKAWLTSFTRGLRYELKSSGVKVSCLTPGGVSTGFGKSAGTTHIESRNKLFMMSPEKVARISIRKALKGKAEIIPGWYNQLAYYLVKFSPKSLVVSNTGRIFKDRNQK